VGETIGGDSRERRVVTGVAVTVGVSLAVSRADVEFQILRHLLGERRGFNGMRRELFGITATVPSPTSTKCGVPCD
jgi:hypothetical protein